MRERYPLLLKDKYGSWLGVNNGVKGKGFFMELKGLIFNGLSKWTILIKDTF